MTDNTDTTTDDSTDDSQRIRTPDDARDRRRVGDPSRDVPPRSLADEVVAHMWQANLIRDSALGGLAGALIGGYLAMRAIWSIAVPTFGDESIVVIGGILFGMWSGIGAVLMASALTGVLLVHLGSTVDKPL